MNLRPADSAVRTANSADARYHYSAALRRQLNKVFPTHWSFLLGEIALYSFLILLLTGIWPVSYTHLTLPTTPYV